MRKTGINMEHVKQQNRSLILHTINRLGPVSRKDLSFLTQLTPASITQTTTALLKEGILVETGTVIEKDAGGRKQKQQPDSPVSVDHTGNHHQEESRYDIPFVHLDAKDIQQEKQQAPADRRSEDPADR